MAFSWIPRLARRPRSLPLGWATVAMALGLAACGKPPSTLPPSYVPPTPLPQPSGSPPPSSGELGQWVEAVDRAAKAIHTWTATARTDMRLPSGGKDFNVSRMRYMRPGWVRAEILEAQNSGKRGTIVVFDGKRQVQVKTYLFGLLPVRATLDVMDKRLLDPYQRSLKDTGTEALMDTFLDPQAKRTVVGEAIAAGEPVMLIDVESRLTYAGIRRDRYGISKRLQLPVMRDSYDAQDRLIYHCELKGMQVNVAMGAKDFTTD